MKGLVKNVRTLCILDIQSTVKPSLKVCLGAVNLNINFKKILTGSNL